MHIKKSSKLNLVVHSAGPNRAPARVIVSCRDVKLMCISTLHEEWSIFIQVSPAKTFESARKLPQLKSHNTCHWADLRTRASRAWPAGMITTLGLSALYPLSVMLTDYQQRVATDSVDGADMLLFGSC